MFLCDDDYAGIGVAGAANEIVKFLLGGDL